MAELQRLSALLLDTPFKAEGIITNITTDANGTRHIALHSEPDIVTRSLSGDQPAIAGADFCLVVNMVLLIHRAMKNRRRMDNIQRYYDDCFNQTLTTTPFLR